MVFGRFCFAFLCLSSLFVLGSSQEAKYVKRVLPAVRAAVPPVIDGDLSDEAWKSAAKAEVFLDRQQGTVGKDQTQAYILFDAKYVYVAYHCIDSDPSKVMARETIRDSKYASSNNGDNPNKEDNVTFSIDPFYTRQPQDQSVFSVNAIGTRSSKIAGGRGDKAEWQGDWDAASKRTADGWSCEFRIPWGMLNYPNKRGKMSMGINFFRFQDHTKTETLWSNVGPQGFTENNGIWVGVETPEAKWKPKVSLLPYALPGYDDERKRFTFRSGVDARYPITPELTAVGSLNPDFGTIEGAVESIAFTHGAHFIPDKRPFFLEGQDAFSTGTRFNDIGAFFYPRTIRTFDLGTKIYGKVTPNDTVGFLNAINFERRSDEILRYTHNLNTTDRLGFFFSDRTEDGLQNDVFVADASFRRKKIGLEGQLGKSMGQGTDGGVGVISANLQDRTLTALIQYHTISNNFVAADGFIPYSGYHGFLGFVDLSNQWRHGTFRSYELTLFGNDWHHFDGTNYYRQSDFSGYIDTRTDWRLLFEANYSVFEGSIDNTYTLNLIDGATNRFRQFGLSVTAGRQLGEPSTFIAPTASLRLLKKLDIGYSGAILHLQGNTSQHIITANYELSPTRSFGGRYVQQDTHKNWYASYRNSGGRGMNYYVILGDPNALDFQRILQLKVVFPIAF